MIPFHNISTEDRLTGLALIAAMLVLIAAFYFARQRRTISFVIKLLQTGNKAQATVTNEIVPGLILSPKLGNNVRISRLGANMETSYEFYDDLGKKYRTTVTYLATIPPQAFQGLKAGDTFTVIYKPGKALLNYPEVFLQRAASGDVSALSFYRTWTKPV